VAAAACAPPPPPRPDAAVTPTVVRHWYGIDRVGDTGAGQVIGIVVAYHDPDLAGDLARFDSHFGVTAVHGAGGGTTCDLLSGPHPCLAVRHPEPEPPNASPPWAVETALDVEWAHAIAPGADILLAEAADDSVGALSAAAARAAAAGATAVDMSWGVPEAGEWRQYATVFEQAGVTFVAPTGDAGHAVMFPASVPSVLAVGGTRVAWAPDRPGGRTETAWARTGGGESSLYARPAYQRGITIGARGRLVPDVAYAAQPPAGYPVVAEGRLRKLAATSAAAPQWAAIVALAAERRGAHIDGTWLHEVLYAEAGAATTSALTDVRTGRNGACGSLCEAGAGYDAVTGLGVPNAPVLLQVLARAETTIPPEESK
jgi:subtilase family serine protease